MDATLEAVNILVSESCRGKRVYKVKEFQHQDSKDPVVGESATKSVLTSCFFPPSVH